MSEIAWNYKTVFSNLQVIFKPKTYRKETTKKRYSALFEHFAIGEVFPNISVVPTANDLLKFRNCRSRKLIQIQRKCAAVCGRTRQHSLRCAA